MTVSQDQSNRDVERTRIRVGLSGGLLVALTRTPAKLSGVFRYLCTILWTRSFAVQFCLPWHNDAASEAESQQDIYFRCIATFRKPEVEHPAETRRKIQHCV